MTPPITWTIGAGGLIGASINAKAAHPFAGSTIPWSDDTAAGEVLASDLDQFIAAASADPWTIVWAAGAATVASSQAQTDAETAVIRGFMERLRLTHPAGDGVFFLTSSAGGVFAGAKHPPFTEDAEPLPIGPYGWSKLANEAAAREVLADTCSVVIGRFSNIYGPGQNLAKMQGLISRLALSAATREPLNLFVPLSTVRDYIYADDAAEVAHLWIDETHAIVANSGSNNVGPYPQLATLRLIASGHGTSVGQLLRTTQDVTHRKVPIAMGSHPSSAMQAPDLRFIPSQPTTGQLPGLTSLPIGMKRVFDAVLMQLQAKPPAVP